LSYFVLCLLDRFTDYRPDEIFTGAIYMLKFFYVVESYKYQQNTGHAEQKTPRQSSFAQHDSTRHKEFRLVAPNPRRLGAKLITKYVLSFLQFIKKQTSCAVRQEHNVVRDPLLGTTAKYAAYAAAKYA
jgi:hypothetical protein